MPEKLITILQAAKLLDVSYQWLYKKKVTHAAGFPLPVGETKRRHALYRESDFLGYQERLNNKHTGGIDAQLASQFVRRSRLQIGEVVR